MGRVRPCKKERKRNEEIHTHVQSWHCLSEHLIFLGFLKKSCKASEYGNASGAGPSIEIRRHATKLFPFRLFLRSVLTWKKKKTTLGFKSRNCTLKTFSIKRKIKLTCPVHCWKIPLTVYTGDGDDQPCWCQNAEVGVYFSPFIMFTGQLLHYLFLSLILQWLGITEQKSMQGNWHIYRF